MAFIPIPGVALVELVLTYLGQTVENTLYFDGTAAWDETSLLDLATDAAGWWSAELKAMASNQAQLVLVRATDLTSQSAPGVEFAPVSAQVGGNTSPAMPGNVTLTTTFVTALRGRSYRGRNYYVGLTEDDCTGNAVTEPRRAAIQGAYEEIPTHIVANGAVHVVASRYHLLAPRNPGIATPVTSYRTETYIDSQRRRLHGRGA